MIERDFSGLDGERITGGAVWIALEEDDVWIRGRDAFRLAEFLLDVLALRDRQREDASAT